MLQRSSFVFALVVIAAGCRQQPKVQSAAGPPSVPVSVTQATQESIPVELRVVGTAEASATVQVKSQVAGQLLKANFTEGQNVAEGQLLFEIDARPFRDALRQAEAALSRDQAQLRQAEAALARDRAQSRNADADAARYAELARAGVISKAQYDQVRTSAEVYRESARAAEAAIESARAAIESDKSAIDKAKLDISYCTIHAPISGRTGNLLVHPGNLVKANDSALVVIHRMSPIWVTFAVPEQHLGAIRSARGRLPVQVGTQQGAVSLVDNAVDTTTGTIKLKAVFDNRAAGLWPGQFVNVVLRLGTIENATIVPTEALQAGQQGQFIYVMKADRTVEPRPVTVGASIERKTVIETGVKPGETIVIDGQLRLFPGAKVQPVDASKLDDLKL